MEGFTYPNVIFINPSFAQSHACDYFDHKNIFAPLLLPQFIGGSAKTSFATSPFVNKWASLARPFRYISSFCSLLYVSNVSFFDDFILNHTQL